MTGRARSRAWSDALAVAVLALAVLLAALFLDFFDMATEWLRAHEHWEPDEVILALAASSVGLAWFGLRRWREARERGLASDLSRSKAEQAIRESEERLRLATEATGLGTYSIDLVTGGRQWSREMRAMLGLSAEAPIGREIMRARIHPEDRAWVEARFARKVADAGEPVQTTYRIVRPDTGAVRWLSDLSRTLADEAGRPVRLVGTLLDVTAEKEAEIALRESEARLRLLTENATDVIARVRLDGTLLYISPASREVLGYEPDEVVGAAGWIEVHPDDRERVAGSVQALLDSPDGAQTITYRLRHKAGRWVAVETRRRLVRDQDGNPVEYVAVCRDISEQRRVEEQLRQAQKMEAVGQLTGGIAHDFNNLLTVVIGNAELLTDLLAEGAPRDLAEVVLNAAERASGLTQRLLAFSRREEVKREPVHLADLAADLAPLLKRTLGATIAIETAPGSGELVAFTDRTLFESAILNLAVNARDAMPTGGRLTIVTGERLGGPSDGPELDGRPLVFVAVSDTGTGMPPEVLQRVFEPFFTTKEAGKGSGLGLAMVHAFAQQSGGRVAVASKLGKGTTVTIMLPGMPRQGSRESDSPRSLARSCGERILLVEDEASVRQLLSSMLTSLGYDVRSVADGSEALALLAECRNGKRYDLLFTDIVLSEEMNGVELVMHARSRQPSLKVLLTSGYPEDVYEEHIRNATALPFLRKPYGARELARAIGEALCAEPHDMVLMQPGGGVKRIPTSSGAPLSDDQARQLQALMPGRLQEAIGLLRKKHAAEARAARSLALAATGPEAPKAPPNRGSAISPLMAE